MIVEEVKILDSKLYRDITSGLSHDGHITITTPMWVGNIDNGYITILVFSNDRNKIIKRLMFDLLDNDLFTATNCSIISTDYATFEIEDDYLYIDLDINMQEESLKNWLPFTRNLENDYTEITDNFRKGKAQGATLVYFDHQKREGATEEDVKHSFSKVVSAWCYSYILYYRNEATKAPYLYAEDGTICAHLPENSIKIAQEIRATNHPEPPVLEGYDSGELNFM